MPLEKWFVDGDCLYPGDFCVAFEGYNSVNHQKRISMRQNLHQLIGLDPAFAVEGWLIDGKGAGPRLLPRNRPRQLGIRTVARLDRNHMPANALTNEREITDNIQDLVADELVGKAQWFFTQDRITADYDGILEAAALDQILLHERLDIFVINERPGRRDFAFKDRRSDFGG
jgi:hypothetical protein